MIHGKAGDRDHLAHGHLIQLFPVGSVQPCQLACGPVLQIRLPFAPVIEGDLAGEAVRGPNGVKREYRQQQQRRQQDPAPLHI